MIDIDIVEQLIPNPMTMLVFTDEEIPVEIR